MAVRSKRFEYAVAVEQGGAMRAEGGPPLETGPEWTPDHLVLGALGRCSLGSLRHHARRAGLEMEGTAAVRGAATRRPEDGRFAIVEVELDMDVRLRPEPEADELRALLARAERDCFVGASLTARPRYAWTVNGAAVEASDASVAA